MTAQKAAGFSLQEENEELERFLARHFPEIAMKHHVDKGVMATISPHGKGMLVVCPEQWESQDGKIPTPSRGFHEILFCEFPLDVKTFVRENFRRRSREHQLVANG